MPFSPPLENVLPANADTLLVIEGISGFKYQARGLTQTLSVVKEAQRQVRTVNGALLDISAPQFRKYATKITCTDINAPPFDGLWPGTAVTIHCAASLCYETGVGSASRPSVSGSEYTEGGFTFYRPVLDMLVVGFNDGFDEWKNDNHWELELEEV